MNLFFCDASALGKRYTTEAGTPVVNHLFESVSHDRLVILTQALGETLSILVRRRNTSVLTQAAYQSASQTLRSELIGAKQVQLRVTDDALVFESLALIEQHSVNSTDALVLAAALDLLAMLPPPAHSVIIVASDLRLLHAATAEGLATFNPETGSIAQLDALIAA